MSYLKDTSTRRTPQSEAIPGETMVVNDAGGYVFPVDDWALLERFLILGTEGGTYYTGQRKLTAKSVDAVLRCLKADGARFVGTVVAVSDGGRAPRNDEALFCLAIAAKKGDDMTRAVALGALPKVARTATHLFQFLGFAKEFGGWGRGFKRAVANWYLKRPVEKVAYQMVKYREREGYSHRDVLRLAKPKPERDSAADKLFAWATGKVSLDGFDIPHASDELRVVEGFERSQRAASPAEAASLVREFNLPREAVKTDYLPSLEVQEALLEDMPITAMIRNLANMTRSGLLTPTSSHTATVVARLGEGERLRKGRVHPISILLAMKTYASGQGLRGGNTWTPVPQVIDALDDAFYETFGILEPTGKRLLVALDVSGSMRGQMVRGVPNLSAREASAAMAMTFVRTEKQYEVVAFSGDPADGATAATSSRRPMT